MIEASTATATGIQDPTHLTIAMCGPNIVIRSTRAIDGGYTAAIADAINAAAVTDTVVILDPEPVRCDDAFARVEHATFSSTCAIHACCEPADAEVVNGSMIRIATELDSWTIDLRGGRFSQAAHTTHHLYLGPEAWVPVVAIVVSRTRLSALTSDGDLITSSRAHRAP